VPSGKKRQMAATPLDVERLTANAPIVSRYHAGRRKNYICSRQLLPKIAATLMIETGMGCGESIICEKRIFTRKRILSKSLKAKPKAARR